jgi:cytochrome c oxidase cbb3-type subunit I/II
MSPGSIMPRYPWLLENTLDVNATPAKIAALRTVGVPYPSNYEHHAVQELELQAQQITQDLRTQGAPAEPDKEIIALIAYLQRLGTDIKGVKR